MKVIGLNGRTYTWNLVGRVVLGDDERPRSKYHLLARELLTELYPLDRILEEVPLPGSDGLTGDFYIASAKLMIEVQGEQHYKYIPHFHTNLLGFIHSKKRDANKRTWCELNNIRLVELPYSEDTNGWKRRLGQKTDGEIAESP